MADEWRAQSFGFAGDPNVHTPQFDKLAAESVNFSETVSGCPVCCPARASLMTGQYPLTHGVFVQDVPLVPKGVTLGEAFHHAGYKTGYIGKWHVYGSPDGHYGRREAFIPPDKHMGFEYWKVAECTHDYNHSFYYEGDDPTKRYWKGYDAIAQTEDACGYIDRQAKDAQPFFLFLSWGPPHFPLDSAPEQYQAMFRNREIELRPNVPPEAREAAMKDLRGYYAHMAALDDCLKKLMGTLERNGLAEDTIVVFTSDHGDMMGSQGLSVKLYPWEESVRVPLLIRYTRKFGAKGRVDAAPVNTPDIMPTLLGLSQIPIPAGVEGTDFSHPAPRDRTGVPATEAYLNLPVSMGKARNYGIAEYRGLRNKRFTYVRSIEGPWLLYDNANDPYQMENLCGKPEAAAIQVALNDRLDLWMAAMNDQFLTSEAYLERDHLTNYFEPYEAVTDRVGPKGQWSSTLQVRQLSVDSPIGNVLKNDRAKALLIRELPAVMKIRKPASSIRELARTDLSISSAEMQRIDHALSLIDTPDNEDE